MKRSTSLATFALSAHSVSSRAWQIPLFATSTPTAPMVGPRRPSMVRSWARRFETPREHGQHMSAHIMFANLANDSPIVLWLGKCLQVFGFALLIAGTLCAGQSFSDSFNRSDGLVGNGWSTWGVGGDILGGQLQTFGAPNVAGGIARLLPMTFPLTFSFDFRTDASGGLDGGWEIGFNGLSPQNPIGAVGSAEFALFQYSGIRPLSYVYQTNTGAQYIEVPLASGQEEYQSALTSHISGSVNADLSSSVTITYPDGTHVNISTPAPPAAAVSPRGPYFALGNSNETFGPHFFDNLTLDAVSGAVPEPRSAVLAGAGALLLLIQRVGRGIKGVSDLISRYHCTSSQEGAGGSTTSAFWREGSRWGTTMRS